MADKVRVRLSIAAVGGELKIRATALDRHTQTYFQAPTEEQAINGLKARLAEYEKRTLFRAKYPKTVEVTL